LSIDLPAFDNLFDCFLEFVIVIEVMLVEIAVDDENSEPSDDPFTDCHWLLLSIAKCISKNELL
jgi:hypothetical protein